VPEQAHVTLAFTRHIVINIVIAGQLGNRVVGMAVAI